MANRGRGTKTKAVEIKAPTPEQMASGHFELGEIRDVGPRASVTIGKAWRRVPMIHILHLSGVLDHEQYRALHHYRLHASMADRSLVRDSLCFQRGGIGRGPSLAILNASRVRDDCDRAAGTLVDILRAVAVDDVSLNQWAIAKAGSVEKRYMRKDRKGRTIPVIEIKPNDEALAIARLEIRMAAERVRAELDA